MVHRVTSIPGLGVLWIVYFYRSLPHPREKRKKILHLVAKKYVYAESAEMAVSVGRAIMQHDRRVHRSGCRYDLADATRWAEGN